MSRVALGERCPERGCPDSHQVRDATTQLLRGQDVDRRCSERGCSSRHLMRTAKLALVERSTSLVELRFGKTGSFVMNGSAGNRNVHLTQTALQSLTGAMPSCKMAEHGSPPVCEARRVARARDSFAIHSRPRIWLRRRQQGGARLPARLRILQCSCVMAIRAWPNASAWSSGTVHHLPRVAQCQAICVHHVPLVG